MTAHHGDDLIETVLMKIVRGSNIKGYSGFPIKSVVDDFYLVRPLIFYTKEDIVKNAFIIKFFLIDFSRIILLYSSGFDTPFYFK